MATYHVFRKNLASATAFADGRGAVAQVVSFAGETASLIETVFIESIEFSSHDRWLAATEPAQMRAAFEIHDD